MLNLCCFLDPEGIPLDLIKRVPDKKAGLFQKLLLRFSKKPNDLPLSEIVTNEVLLDDAIGALRRYSLMQRSDDELSLHRLVQAVARSQMGEERAREWVEVAVDLLRKAYRYDKHDMTTWAACGDLLPHLSTATDLAEQYGCETNNAAFLNNEAGYYVNSRGSYAAARPYYERALAIREKALGPDHPDTAQSLNNLAVLFAYQGDFDQAIPLMRRVLDISEKKLGSDHPKTQRYRNSIANMEADAEKQ